ncbi:hypothetical protein LCGC14_0343050 [marine sediment metagenome]|uniref:VRR-NUC domain-containing protein n=1 Tax=marine sediment metagenome TaxID=412755 RepID=A0A0F9TVY3_9ZZZZ
MRRPSKEVRFKRIAAKILGQDKMTDAQGGMPTKSVVPVDEDAPESEVTKLCNSWLERHGCVMDRLNNGAGMLGYSRSFLAYGIIGGGDMVGMLPCGKHLEVEYKKGKGGRLSRSQLKRMARVHRGKGLYIVVHGVPELEHKLKGYL